MKPNISNDALFLSLVKEETISVSKNGDVFNNITGKTIGFVTGGYKRINMFGYTMAVHRLVYLCYISEEIPEGLLINHIDGNKLNNNYLNLEIVTESENQKHAFRIGLRSVPAHLKEIDNNGQNNGKAKLSNEDAIEIRKRRIDGEKVKDIASLFNVSETCIKHVIGRKTFRNI